MTSTDSLNRHFFDQRFKRRSVWGSNYLLALVVTVLLLSVITAWGLAAQSNTGQIISILSGWCLQPLNESTAQGAAIVQEPCNNHDNDPAQQWTRVPVSGNIVHFVNGLSGLCLDARGAAANGTPVQQWTCNKISNENWDAGDGAILDDNLPPLISRVSGTDSHCLDVPGGQKVSGLAMQIYRCNGTLSQIWWTP